MKISIHPLFFGVVIYCAFFGGLPVALIFVLTAILHECGHIFCAAGMGYSCERIRLMPYGASAMIDMEGIRPADELKLALAGPAVNAFLCVACAGLWWFFPVTYAYTDTVMYANLTMLAVNLLPAYPLDGGRAFKCVLRTFLGERAAYIALRIACALISAALFALFFLSGFNVTILFFSLFLACSAAEKNTPACKVGYAAAGRLKRGVEINYVLVDEGFTYKDAMKLLDGRRYLVLQLYDGGVADEMTQDELLEAFASHSVYDRIFAGGDYFSRKLLTNSDGSGERESTEETASTPKDTPSSTAPEREE